MKFMTASEPENLRTSTNCCFLLREIFGFDGNVDE